MTRKKRKPRMLGTITYDQDMSKGLMVRVELVKKK